MKRWKVVIELAAIEDVAEARQWLSERDPAAAERWFDSLYDTIGSLEILPERCPFAPGNGSINFEIRQIFHGRRHYKYRILFAVSEGIVHVLHVRHGARLPVGETESQDE